MRRLTFSLFAFASLLTACIKKEDLNPDDLITYEKHVFLSKINSCDTIFTFYIPNGFTPNGDWINEFWEPKSCGLDSSQYHISILDKSGKNIFDSEYPVKFDGTAKNGMILPQQTLCFFIEAKDKFGGSYEFKGKFAIIR